MANIGKVLKEEIIRLSKKNASALTKPLKTELRSLKHQLRAMKADIKAAQAALTKCASAPVPGTEETEGKTPGKWFSGRGIKAMRRKFKLTQAQFAALAKVSPQAVVMWERKTGKIRLRHATLASLTAIRSMKKADIKVALGTKPAKKAKKIVRKAKVSKSAK